MDKKQQTIDTYNQKAEEFAEKFNSTGTRVDDIEEILSLIEKKDPRVLEIGCGNGRDAVEIIKHTKDYLGIDISDKLIEIARKTVPKGRFLVADIEEYSFPDNLDIIFAFASLIHVPKPNLASIINKALAALNTNGVFKISLKHATNYTETTKTDRFGTRTYYLYSEDDMKDLAQGYKIIKNQQNVLRGQTWLEVILKKK